VTRRNKLIILIAYLFILAIALPVYRMKRASVEKRLKAQISAAQQEKAKATSAASEMERLRQLFPTEPGTAPFIEALYSAAQQSKLAAHDVKTDAVAARAASRTPSRNPAAQADAVSSHRFSISLEGSFRNVAEYIRRIQNFERFKRITEIKLAPAKQGVSGTISLELFSLKDQNAR
jgi:Tfp pilus assembly protein PilO